MIHLPDSCGVRVPFRKWIRSSTIKSLNIASYRQTTAQLTWLQHHRHQLKFDLFFIGNFWLVSTSISNWIWDDTDYFFIKHSRWGPMACVCFPILENGESIRNDRNDGNGWTHQGDHFARLLHGQLVHPSAAGSDVISNGASWWNCNEASRFYCDVDEWCCCLLLALIAIEAIEYYYYDYYYSCQVFMTVTLVDSISRPAHQRVDFCLCPDVGGCLPMDKCSMTFFFSYFFPVKETWIVHSLLFILPLFVYWFDINTTTTTNHSSLSFSLCI